MKQKTLKYAISGLLILTTFTANAKPSGTIYTSSLASEIDKGDAELALLKDEKSLIYKCRAFAKTRKGIKAEGESYYVAGNVSGYESKGKAKRDVAKGAEVFECKRQAINYKGNLSNW